MKLSQLLAIQCSILTLMTAFEPFAHARSERISSTPIAKAESTEKSSTISNKANKTQENSISTTTKTGASTLATREAPIDITRGFSEIAEPSLPSVVNVATTQIIDPKIKGERPSMPSGTPFDELFREFFDNQQSNAPRKVQSLGSGFIIRVTKEFAFIVTNNHVIADAKKITVFLHDKTELEAAVHAADERTDIAVLKVKLSDLPEYKRNIVALDWGNADETHVGDWVVAIGNPFGLGSSVTAGIVSSKGRDLVTPGRGRVGDYVDDFLQHSAQINMGNSGGCLINMKRQVIGVNTAIFSPTGGNVGIGFAVPSGVAKKTVDQLIDFGRTKRGWLGLRIQHLTDDMAEALGLKVQGAIVGGVTTDGPAKNATIQEGDIIIEYDGKAINDQNRLTRLVGETEIGKAVPIKVWRKGKEIILKVTVGEYEEAVKSGRMEEADASKVQNATTTDILGVSLAPITETMRKKWNLSPQAKGVIILKVEPASAGEDAELIPGEVIVEVNQKEVGKPEDVVNLIKEAKKNGRKNVMLLVTRKGEPRYPSLRIEEDQKRESKPDDSQSRKTPAKARIIIEHPANSAKSAPGA
ncbi:MAG: Do family serine endopeptidase [Candidatus Paracaedibacteraceae bacterium]|nr:Do family serine endopeptidase [Candidatus Paracaedibacteraceae bacterium]